MRSKSIDAGRRRFFGAAAAAFVGARFGASTDAAPFGATPETSFATLKYIDAGVLNIGYADAGRTDASAVLLIHGWPYDIHTYVEVAPMLVKAGYRVIVPYLRGFGTTRFLSNETMRNAQQSALADDVVALMDALAIKTAIVAGCDWGSDQASRGECAPAASAL